MATDFVVLSAIKFVYCTWFVDTYSHVYTSVWRPDIDAGYLCQSFPTSSLLLSLLLLLLNHGLLLDDSGQAGQ